jgi:hypothetical protein
MVLELFSSATQDAISFDGGLLAKSAKQKKEEDTCERGKNRSSAKGAIILDPSNVGRGRKVPVNFEIFNFLVLRQISKFQTKIWGQISNK